MKTQPAPQSEENKDLNPTSVESMDILKYAETCAAGAIDKKAENLIILDVAEKSGFADYFVICSAMSDRQIQAIANSIEEKMRLTHKIKPRVEGFSEGRWVLMDFGNVLVHIFQDAVREYYNLEGLWADAARVPVPSHLYGTVATRSEEE